MIDSKIIKVFIEQLKALKSPFVYVANGYLYALSNNFEFTPFRYSKSILEEGCIKPSIISMDYLKLLEDASIIFVTPENILNIASSNIYYPAYNYSLLGLLEDIIKYDKAYRELPVIYKLDNLCSDETIEKLVKIKSTDGNEIYYVTPNHPITFMNQLIYSNKSDIVNMEIRDTPYNTFIADIIVEKKKYSIITRYHMLKL